MQINVFINSLKLLIFFKLQYTRMINYIGFKFLRMVNCVTDYSGISTCDIFVA